MCGISGKLMFEPEATVAPTLMKSMADAMVHRGPDDEGYYLSGPVGLGFRRLSIIDLNTGHQPISNEDGSVWVIFNGEIYNYRELREQLRTKGHSFSTNTDTEVLVHLYEEHGPGMLEKLRGMFAFAIWDDKQRTLLLARDRVGIKPIYYYQTGRFLSFASELKAILADPDVEREIDPAMIDRFLTFYYMPGEETLFKHLRKLPPGSYLRVRGDSVEVKAYWDLSFEQKEPAPDVRRAERQLIELLEEAVQLHMVSDVPVGFLLSGGVDSTAMLSLAAGRTHKAISSYTVGFSSGVVDERPYARLAAERFGSEHHEITISAREFADFLPSYVWHMEEPVCEPPAIALYYVSKLARNHVKVLISGEGGDEAFAGYSKYRNFLWLERMKRVLGPAWGPASSAVRALNRIIGSPKLALYARLIDLPLDRYYYSKTSHPFTFFNCQAGSLYAKEFAGRVDKGRSLTPVQQYLQKAAAYGILEKMLYVDSKSWLPDDLLVKADKMTMANSVELRVPFLDHKVLEFAAALPTHFKVRGLTTKYLAKKALSTRVPPEIIARKKAGFPVPYELWLRTELRDWLRQILLDRETLSRGYFERGAVEGLLASGVETGGYVKELFSLATLEMWHRTFLPGKPGAGPRSRDTSVGKQTGTAPFISSK
jgi:asparagine synthase (glutamine-hydrolysing)